MQPTEGRDENGKLIRVQLDFSELEPIYTQYLLSNEYNPNGDIITDCLKHHLKADYINNAFQSKRPKITKKGLPYKQKKDGSFRKNGYVEVVNLEYYGTGR